MSSGLNGTESRKRLQATRALFMTIERRQVKEALLLNKQNKDMQRWANHRLDIIYAPSDLV